MSDFRFANPGWVHALWFVFALVGALIWFDRRGGAALQRFLSRSMQPRLVRRLPPARRGMRIALIGLASVALVVGLMRPQWGLTYRRLPRVGAQIMVCLDVSKSMLAEDTAPNRLERAKADLADLLTFLEGDQVGLIAFAGKASVLCPLTPDFGFFRLILEGAGPHSVGRGGTRLEAPIRKALAGFRSESDVSRTILLVTDGEDQDSVPMDAAKEAAERGIRIIAIGFGDEGGSEIQITDPDTGVRTTLRDSNGKPVRTALDGETLRNMALVTEGAYIPAGTGSLDLQSIYEAHLASLVRGQLDDRGHPIRREGFQWAVLAGLVFLTAAVVVGSVSLSDRAGWLRLIAPNSTLPKGAAAVAMALGLGWAGPGAAQQDPSGAGLTGSSPMAAPADANRADANRADANKETKEPSPSTGDEEIDPRALFNEALASLGGDPDRAERLLTRVRRDAGTDGEARFRATYNLGWVEVKRADAQLKEAPEQALEHLHAAAGWFRDAIRLRPEHSDARHNLEVILRRAMALADSLAKKDGRDLTQRLDDLIKRQRSLMGAVGELVEQVTALDDPNAPDRFRAGFRAQAVQQRTVLSDSQALVRVAREELDAIQAKKDENQSPDERLRAAQLTNLLHYANRANQRMGQARSQLRRRQGPRAFRRSSMSLTELKRARDQLRDPVEVLSLLLGDAMTLAQFTARLASSHDLASDSASEAASTPAWLTREYLEETQESIADQTAELEARLQAGLKEHDAAPIGPRSPNEKPPDPKREQLLATVRQAVPLVTEGKEAFVAAHHALGDDALGEASQRQIEGIRALREARERFLDLRGLIELTYAEEAQVESVLSPKDEQGQTYLRDLVHIAHQLQTRNLQRCGRLDELMDVEMAALPATNDPGEGGGSAPATKPGSGPSKDAQDVDAQRQRLVLAKELLQQATAEMTSATEDLNTLAEATDDEATGGKATDDEATNGEATNGEATNGEATNGEAGAIDQERLASARGGVERAVEQLQALRRLFFSIVEHLRETAQRQTQLNDETEAVSALADDQEKATRLGPLAAQQQNLKDIATEIAAALKEQSQLAPAQPTDREAADQKQMEQHRQTGAILGQAADLVETASRSMAQASEQMAGEAPELESARQEQDTALERLVEALSLLVPPEQQGQDQQPPEQRQDQGQGESKEQPQPSRPQAEDTDPARLLQAVRDREAQRRRDKSRRSQAPLEPVEKDW